MSRGHFALPALALAAATGLVVTALPATADVRFTPGAPGAGDPYFPDMGNGGYDVKHYDIDLKFDPATGTIKATTLIKARATQNLSRFDLDFLGPLTISRLKVNDRKAPYVRSGAQELVISPKKGLRKGHRFTVEVSYSGKPHKINDPALGISGWAPTADGAVMLNQPIGAATVYPVNDTPQDKATYTFTLTAPNGLTTLANGDPAGKWTKKRWTTSRWKMRQPMSSELSMIAIGKYNVTTGKTVHGFPNITAIGTGIDTKPGQGLAFNKFTDETTRWQEGIFGRYPFSSNGGIINTFDVGYALETQGRPVYDQPSSELEKETIVHELAHQWFGDSVTPKLWKGIWLNEGFATYSEWLYIERSGGAGVDATFKATYDRPATDPRWKLVTADPGRNNIFAWTVYNRGAMTLHSLRKAIGDKAFFTLVKRWTTENRYGNASTEDFIELAQKVSGKDLTELFRKWVFTAGKPAL